MRTETRAIEGATPAKMPSFIKPQLATLRSKAPKGPQWLHEIKLDGYRVQVHLNKGKKKVFTRTGLDWTKRDAKQNRHQGTRITRKAPIERRGLFIESCGGTQ
jgi:ATP-dependent DNA ligase